jgi:hypothetical protein
LPPARCAGQLRPLRLMLGTTPRPTVLILDSPALKRLLIAVLI